MDLTETITPKSDQLNADDLMTGERLVTIVEVTRGNSEQPVNVITHEFGPGRPYKPCKSMRRVMVAGWGEDSSTYPGRRMVLHRDPTVRFGKSEVGGIRISHMSDLPDGKPLKLALTVTRGQRAPYVVQPLSDQPAPQQQQPSPLGALGEAFKTAGIEDRQQRMDYCARLVGRDITSPADLSADEVQQVTAALTVLRDTGAIR